VARPKLERRRQALIYPGLDCRKVVRRRAPNGMGLTLWAHFGGGLRGASRRRGNRTLYECSYRVSVAEVGEKHLSGAVKVSREASQGGAG
jgi:hypothetical protein